MDKTSIEPNFEQIARDLDTFVYAVSHDMSAPIRAVSGFSRLIMDRQGSAFDPKTREQFQYIIRAGEELQSMLNALTEYSRLTTRPNPFEDMVAYDMLSQALNNQREDIIDSDMVVEMDVEDGMHIYGDIPRLTRLFTCLMSNAVVFRDAQRAGRVKLVGWQDNERQYFSLTDNGIGLTTNDETKERIFRPFGRLHRQEEYPGIGMGLTLAKKIARLHNGDIDVESAPGEGSRFTVILPSRRAA